MGRRDTTDVEIKVPSVENSELTNVLPLKPGVGQNIATQASPTARNFFLVLISTFHLSSFFLSKSSPYFLTSLVLTDAVSRVGPPNKIGHPAHGHKRFKKVPGGE